MEEEKKKFSRKALIGIIVALIIIVVIALGVIIFFISSGNKEIGKNISSETTLADKEIIDKISKVLDNVNNEYELGFNPNTEQMNEIIDFYKNTSNFDEESLFKFIGEKGWTIRGNGEIDNSQVGNQSSNFSDNELKEFIKERFYSYSSNKNQKIDRVEKYEDNRKGKYIYVLYHHLGEYNNVFICFINATNSGQLISEKEYSTKKDNIEETIETTKQELNWYETNNSSSNFSDSDIKKFIEQRFYKTNDENYDTIDKIEKYDEDGTGKYIYIVYSQRYITVNGNFHYEDFVDVCSVDTTQSSQPRVELTSVGSSSALDSAIEKMKSKINWNTSGNSTSSSTLNYKSDDELKVLAFKKWLEKDEYISLQYSHGNNPSCFYTGNITRNADGSVSVHLKLYPDKKLYEDAIKYTGSTDGVGTLGSATIKLTKVEATR